MAEPVGATEVTVFEPLPGIDADEVMRRAGEAAAALKACGGFVQRLVSRDESGQWIDIVQWESLDAALHAETQTRQAPAIAAFAGLMAPGALFMRQADPSPETAN